MNEPKPTTADLQRTLDALDNLPITHTAAPMSVGMALAVLRELVERREADPSAGQVSHSESAGGAASKPDRAEGL